MGVDISAIKVGKYIGEDWTKELEEKDNVRNIFCYDFSPMIHLGHFKQGLYETEYLTAPRFSMSYGGFNTFREEICRMANKCEPDRIWENPVQWIGKPFAEFINFADNEGSFDFAIAKKLYNDFHTYKDKAEKTLDEYLFGKYIAYMEILKQVYENKGVVYYH